MDTYERQIRMLLLQFGITSRYKAFPLLVEGVRILLTGECRGDESLYRMLAARHGGDGAGIARALQRLVRVAWKNNPSLWREVMGGPPSRRQSAKYMVYTVADWLTTHDNSLRTAERPLP